MNRTLTFEGKVKETFKLLCDYRVQGSDTAGGVDKLWKGKNANINKMFSELEKAQWSSL